LAATWAGWWAAGGLTTLGYFGASEPRQTLGGVPADFRLLGRKQKTSQKWGRLRERRIKGLNNLKRAQAIKFKCEFEFNQPKSMHQHECNK
jgi:hypothetical protein